VFSGARTDYEIRADGTALRVMRKGHPEDTSLLHNVESLQFDDAVLNSADLRIVDGNIAPLAKDLSLSTPEDQALTLTLAELTASVVDLDGNGAVTLVAAEAATGGTATLTPEGGVVFTPDPDFNGDAAFTLTFADADGPRPQPKSRSMSPLWPTHQKPKMTSLIWNKASPLISVPARPLVAMLKGTF